MDFYISLFLTIYLVFGTYIISFSNADILITKESQTLDKFEEILPPKATPPRCGQAFHYDNYGIFYKAFEPVLSNERCTWVLGTPNALGYTITIEYLGYPTNQPESGQELVITGARWSSSTTSPNLTYYRPTSTGLVNVTEANIAIITFYSCDLSITNGTGFALQYKAIYEGDNTRTWNESMHYVFESPTFDFKYPQNAVTYGMVEFAAFLFPPNQNVYGSGYNHVLYKKGELEGNSCTDSLFVYGLNVCPTLAGNEIWQQNGRICGNVTTQKIDNDDMTLIIFSCDYYRSGSGFSFSYSSC